jgi:acetamidase/formamidase
LPIRNIIKRGTFHYKWSRSHRPALYIRPGDKVTFEINEVTSWQITKQSTAQDLTKLDAEKFYPLAGPVYVEGARPGDALSVEILEVRTDEWGWSAIIPGFGLLEEFKEPYLWIWDLEDKRYAEFKGGLRIPLNPFCGVMGVAPAEEGFFEVMPPGRHGGNMDIRHLVKGSKLLLPVFVEGALFSVGDVHAAQGDGEVCVTAIECPGEATLGFDVIRGANLPSPLFFAKQVREPRGEYVTATGISNDLMEAAKLAVRHMIEYLQAELNLTKEEAYILCSVAGDLRIHEVVDRPNWVVGLMLPQAIASRASERVKVG